MLFEDKLKKLRQIGEIKMQGEIIKMVGDLNYEKKLFSKQHIEVIEIFKPDAVHHADIKVGNDEYFYYSGPQDKRNRPFCAYMMRLDKVFKRETIDWMTFRIGYDVLKYKGSYGCRHSWIRFRGKYVTTPLPTDRQIDGLIRDQILDGFGD